MWERTTSRRGLSPGRKGDDDALNHCSLGRGVGVKTGEVASCGRGGTTQTIQSAPVLFCGNGMVCCRGLDYLCGCPVVERRRRAMQKFIAKQATDPPKQRHLGFVARMLLLRGGVLSSVRADQARAGGMPWNTADLPWADSDRASSKTAAFLPLPRQGQLKLYAHHGIPTALPHTQRQGHALGGRGSRGFPLARPPKTSSLPSCFTHAHAYVSHARRAPCTTTQAGTHAGRRQGWVNHGMFD